MKCNCGVEAIRDGVCFKCEYWIELAEVIALGKPTDTRQFCVDSGKIYTLEPEWLDETSRGSLGAGFIIIWKNGDQTITHNLWPIGEVPEWLREKFSSNCSITPL